MVLYALGSNGSGQLGIGHTEDVSVPTTCQINHDGDAEHPVFIAGGGNHTLILTRSGRLFASGDLSAHLPSHGSASSQRAPASQALLVDQGVSHCSATWEASIMSYAGGTLRSSGNGGRGELGRDALAVSSAIAIPYGAHVGEHGIARKVADVASGLQHTVVVFDDGQVYGWGNGRKGQLGEPALAVTAPRKIGGIDFAVRRAVCGREFTYLVGDALEGRHLILGSDKWGVKSQAPAAVPGWTHVGANWGSMSVLLQSGRVLAWGRDDHCQLAPPSLPLLSIIACGSEHCLALTREGQVLAWGWGEHGNCGAPAELAEAEKRGWNALPLPDGSGAVVGLGAGCATSWIWTASAT